MFIRILGDNDIVRCFCCDLGLAEWDPKDNPWTEHARHNPKCHFLKNKKGDEYIESIQQDWRKVSSLHYLDNLKHKYLTSYVQDISKTILQNISCRKKYQHVIKLLFLIMCNRKYIFRNTAFPSALTWCTMCFVHIFNVWM